MCIFQAESLTELQLSLTQAREAHSASEKQIENLRDQLRKLETENSLFTRSVDKSEDTGESLSLFHGFNLGLKSWVYLCRSSRKTGERPRFRDIWFRFSASYIKGKSTHPYCLPHGVANQTRRYRSCSCGPPYKCCVTRMLI